MQAYIYTYDFYFFTIWRYFTHHQLMKSVFGYMQSFGSVLLIQTIMNPSPICVSVFSVYFAVFLQTRVGVV